MKVAVRSKRCVCVRGNLQESVIICDYVTKQDGGQVFGERGNT